jgi:hypothetical protein
MLAVRHRDVNLTVRDLPKARTSRRTVSHLGALGPQEPRERALWHRRRAGPCRRRGYAADLEIEEVGRPLTDVEKSATIRDLLTARSGIYHASVKDDNGPYPPPGTHRPGEAFVYNNWNFNALGGSFEREPSLSLGAAFKTWIADLELSSQGSRPLDERPADSSSMECRIHEDGTDLVPEERDEPDNPPAGFPDPGLRFR